jgi:chromosome segregation ATPase
MGTNPMTAAMVLADFRLTDARTQSKSLLCSKLNALAQYAANYHNSYEKLSTVLHERTKALRDAEAQLAELQAERDGQAIPTTENPTR